MNWETISYIFAVVLGLSAFTSPVVTTILNNKHQQEINKQNNELQIKLKNLELYFPLKNQAVDNYLTCLSNYLNHQSNINLYNYQSAMAKVSMYSSADVRNSLCSINYFIEQKNFLKALDLFFLP